MRIPALLLTVLCVLVAASPAAAQEAARPVVAPEFAEQFPALAPLTAKAQNGSGSAADGALGPDGAALLAAAYWLCLAALALRRARLRHGIAA